MLPESIKNILAMQPEGQEIETAGWVRTFRSRRFIHLNDGSCIEGLQVVVDFEQMDEGELDRITPGASLRIFGNLVPSEGKGQPMELLAKSLKVLGEAPADLAHGEVYPLQPKAHSLEFLREQAHLRFRTQTFAAVFRLRHAMAFAMHKFFHERGFFWLHTPILTASDAEGAGEMFRVTSLDLANPPKKESGEIDFSKDFFGKAAHLTVSGQLEAELGALGLGKVYTFGPTFRAENSNTTRHLAEFWMVEPEVAFADLDDNMDLAEANLKYLVAYALKHCKNDLDFLADRFAKEESTKKQDERSSHGLIERLELVLAQPFERMTYTQALELLKNSKPNKKGKFVYPITAWGADLQSEHERYLVEKEVGRPIILSDYPKEIKAFYMRLGEDGTTVRAMDILFPGIGEMVGGSQREERLEVLKKRMRACHISEEELWWYLDTRKFGTVPHSGYGLGFERFLLFVTGMTNIRDVIAFPRFPKHIEF